MRSRGASACSTAADATGPAVFRGRQPPPPSRRLALIAVRAHASIVWARPASLLTNCRLAVPSYTGRSHDAAVLRGRTYILLAVLATLCPSLLSATAASCGCVSTHPTREAASHREPVHARCTNVADPACNIPVAARHLSLIRSRSLLPLPPAFDLLPTQAPLRCEPGSSTACPHYAPYSTASCCGSTRGAVGYVDDSTVLPCAAGAQSAFSIPMHLIDNSMMQTTRVFGDYVLQNPLPAPNFCRVVTWFTA